VKYTSTQAAILAELKKPLIVDEIQLPEELDAGQVLVRIEYSGICGSQIGEIDGAKGEDKFLPHLLGHEGYGEVIEIGAGVRYVAPGDKVILHWRKGSGIESRLPIYGWKGKQLNAGWVTTFNEMAVISENRITKAPVGIDPKVACLYGCAITTGFGVITNNAKLKIGESVVIFGAGGIGLNIVQAASMTSGWPVIAVDVYDHKLELAKAMGATHLINSAKQDAEAEIKKILGNRSLDVFIDNTGQPSIIEMGYGLAGPLGRVILVGVPKAGQKSSLFTLPLHFGKVLTGSHGGDAIPEVDIKRYHMLFQAKNISIQKLITHEIKLSEINDAIARMRDGSIAGRVVIKFT
jgi:S-(hydroxymethyl)glutathione dehydrogenase/alcohol dehydrogenase